MLLHYLVKYERLRHQEHKSIEMFDPNKNKFGLFQPLARQPFVDGFAPNSVSTAAWVTGIITSDRLLVICRKVSIREGGGSNIAIFH